MIKLIPHNLVFGLHPDLYRAPVLNPPPGAAKIKLRFRANAFTKAYVRTADGVREFLVQKVGDALELCFEQGANIQAAA